MNTISTKLLVMIAAGALALTGCPTANDSDEGGSTDAAEDTSRRQRDAGTPDTSGPTPDTGNDSTIPTPDTGTDTGTDDPCGCNGGLWECGLGTLGCSCGDCLPTEECDASHQCGPITPAENGEYCGPTTACGQVPDFRDSVAVEAYNSCIGAQCQSGLCLGYDSRFMAEAPVCSTACTIRKDDNLDGIEDTDAPFSDCDAFVTGPSGQNFSCVNFADPAGLEDLTFCAPGTTFLECQSDTDCASGEACNLTSFGGVYSRRCLASLESGGWFEPSELGDSCNFYDAFDPEGLGYCDGGLCFGLGCVTFCEQDSDCAVNGLNWSCPEEPFQIFSNLPELTYRLCWPDSCETEADCADGSYCNIYWNGEETQDTASWDNLCLPETTSGVDTGDACDPDPTDLVPGDTCAADTLCFGGYCSAVCGSDDDCAVDKDQLCVVEEIGFDLDDPDDGFYEFVLPLSICLSFPDHSGVECYSDDTCEDGEFCEFFLVENLVDDGEGGFEPHPAGPTVVRGVCRPKEADTGEWGSTCESPADCASQVCLGADADTGTSGICSKMCESVDECESVTIDSETSTGRCSSLFYSWNGALDNVLGYNYVSLCLANTPDSSGADCSTDFSCSDGDDMCIPMIIGFGPDYPAVVEYQCVDRTNADDSEPTKTLGQACDPDLEDTAGNSISECLSGFCALDVAAGTGYCSALCDPDADTCAADSGVPVMSCESYHLRERGGAYVANSAVTTLCMKNVECLPCASENTCPGDRVCANLGQDEDLLADYRCVDPCETAAQCAGSTATVCNDGLDAYGRAVRGCFDKATYPVNHCD